MATTVLTVTMACSSAGACWLQFAGTTHGCCAQDQDTTIAPFTRPCASRVISVIPVEVAPPAESAQHVVAHAKPFAASHRGEAFAPGYTVVSPPLILRI